jgi:uncharacterized protein
MEGVNPQHELFSCENNNLNRGKFLATTLCLHYLGTFLPEMFGTRPMRETITAALKDATKAQDKRRVSTLRLVSAAIKDRDIAARTVGKTQATDAELLELFAKMIKQREESQKIYADAGRAELAKQESEEIEIIREFLPKQLSDKEMEKAIASAIAESNATSVKDMGKVMAALKARYAGQMDFAKASALVKAKLG